MWKDFLETYDPNYPNYTVRHSKKNRLPAPRDALLQQQQQQQQVMQQMGLHQPNHQLGMAGGVPQQLLPGQVNNIIHTPHLYLHFQMA